MEKDFKKEIKLELVLDEQVAEGQYVNLAVVNHNESEFVVDSVFVQPKANKAKVKSRLIMSPQHAKRLMKTLELNVEAYEKKFGEIESQGWQEMSTKPIH